MFLADGETGPAAGEDDGDGQAGDRPREAGFAPPPATTSSCRRSCRTAENPDPEEEAVVVIARSTQEAVVISFRACTSWIRPPRTADRHGRALRNPGLVEWRPMARLAWS